MESGKVLRKELQVGIQHGRETREGVENTERQKDSYADVGQSSKIFTIDVSEEIEEDLECLKDLTIICKFVGPRFERKKIQEWIKENWDTPQITKFLSRGFFIVIFATEEERQKVLEGGLWSMGSAPLYIQLWHRNFNPLKTFAYDKPLWVRLNYLPMEYWTEEALCKIGRSLGTLLEIDREIAEGDSYLYARIFIAVVRKIPSEVRLVAQGQGWIQTMEIEEDKYFCLECGKRDHSSRNCKSTKKKTQTMWKPIGAETTQSRGTKDKKGQKEEEIIKTSSVKVANEEILKKKDPKIIQQTGDEEQSNRLQPVDIGLEEALLKGSPIGKREKKKPKRKDS
ncbi:hypothetical protein SUGI_0359760 [Cryptomeria japonica]|nr:hypothetical protein SUGI_0359760 [Cryptomeria japonica]